jgi:hypothetical protein
MAKQSKHKEKIEIFALGYQEVLAALKHQDDKLNRTLTALAFLTVAGVGLFPQISESEVVFGGSGPRATAVLFVVFLVAVAIGVTIALAAIGPGKPLPKNPSRHLPSSLLYYAFISRDRKWKKKKGWPPEKLLKKLAKDLHNETREISYRVDYKVARAREASTWVQLVIVSLALMGIFGASGISSSARWWIASGLLFVVLSIPFWELLLMRKTRYASENFSRSAYWILLGIVTAAVCFLVLGDLFATQWQALGYAAVAFIVPRYAIVQSKWTMALMIAGLVAIAPAALLTALGG